MHKSKSKQRNQKQSDHCMCVCVCLREMLKHQVIPVRNQPFIICSVSNFPLDVLRSTPSLSISEQSHLVSVDSLRTSFVIFFHLFVHSVTFDRIELCFVCVCTLFGPTKNHVNASTASALFYLVVCVPVFKQKFM